MLTSWISRLLGKTTNPSRRQRRAARSATRPSFRPRLESLEERMLLSATLPISIASSGPVMGNGSSSTAPASISANGQYEVFTSWATDLVKGVTIQPWSWTHVYLRNLSAGTTSLVDVATNGTESGNNSANYASITPDGRYVAFYSNSNDLTSNDASIAHGQFYVRDMLARQTFLVSLGANGSPENAGPYQSSTPSIAEDGKGHLLLAYQSNANNLTTGDTNSTNEQIFLATFNLSSTGAIQYSSLKNTLVSATSSGNGAGTGVGQGGDSLNPILSKDGSTLEFNSYAINLNVPGGYNDNNPYVDNLYLYSVANKTLKLLSAEPTTTAAATANRETGLPNDPSGWATAYQESISANGQYAVFASSSDNLVPGLLTYGWTNVYRRDLLNGTTSLVSINDTGKAGVAVGSFAGSPVITADGRYVAFVSDSPNLTSNSNGSSQVYVRDMQQGVTYLVSLGIDGKPANATPWIESIAESTTGQLVLAYRSNATNLASKDTSSNSNQIFVTAFTLNSSGDIAYSTRVTKLVSADGSGNPGNDDSEDAILSKDGSTLAFESRATNLAGEKLDNADGHDHVQVFTYNLASGKLTQVSLAPPTGDTTDSSWLSSISDNGQYLTYDSQNNTTGVGEIFAWNASTGKNTVIYNTKNAAYPVLGATLISGDGSTIAMRVGNVYGRAVIDAVHNWQAGAPTIALVSPAPSSSVFSSEDPSISDNGKVIAYHLSPMTGTGQIYVYNSGTTTEISPNNNGTDFAPEVSADSSTVFFDSTASNLVAGIASFNPDQSNSDNIFAYNVASKTVALVSAKAPGLFTIDSDSNSPSISNNGRYIAFNTSANDYLGGLPYGPSLVVAEDLQKGVPTVVNSAAYPVLGTTLISGDGSSIVYRAGNVYGRAVIDLMSNWQTGSPTITQVSASPSSSVWSTEEPSISDNGKVIAYHLTPGSGPAQVYVWKNGTTTEISAAASGGNSNGDADTPVVSGDGSTIVFNSSATNLVSGVSVATDSSGNPITPNVYGYALSANHFVVSMPSIAVTGASFQIKLTAENVINGVVTGYNGTVHLTSSDAKAVLPASVTFVNGVATATVTLNTAGTQTITATDASNPDLTCTSSIATYTNISADLQVTRGTMTYNSTTKEYTQSLTLTNTSQLTFSTGIALLLTNLSANATLANAKGIANGDPYLDLATPTGGLMHGQSLTVTLYFKNSTTQSITYGTEELAGRI